MGKSKLILEYLPDNISSMLYKVIKQDLIEIRLRANCPLQVVKITGDSYISPTGHKVSAGDKAYMLTAADLKRAFILLCKNSIYALERQLREGFITIPGGHRVGFTGQAVMEKGAIKTIKNINSLNYRITREMTGIARKIIPLIYDKNTDYIYNTLIISPPLCGKTTLLRDLVRIISSGYPAIGLSGKKVGVVDERSEIGGSYNGIPQNSIGNRTDLLDNCPKAQGILLLLRSMSPELIAADEIGRDEDVKAITEAVNAGVSLLTTIHGQDLRAVRERPSAASLLKRNAFERFIILSKKRGMGTIESVTDRDGREVSRCLLKS
ncbi:MAG TPA: stage III sporulation protein AA [Halanaerobiales bacterium]|nr:stage III sporulation protein AA [Halanaerobiales bacterium]